MPKPAGVAVLTCALLLSGCSTMFVRTASPANRGHLDFYPATTFDLFTIVTGGGLYAFGDCDNGLGPVVGWLVVVPLSIIDLPISLVTDTVMLPADIARFHRLDNLRDNRATESTYEPFDRQFTMTVGQVCPSVPGIILMSSSGYPERQATFRTLSTEELMTVKINGQFRCGDPPRTFLLVYSDPELVLLMELPEN